MENKNLKVGAPNIDAIFGKMQRFLIQLTWIIYIVNV